MIDGTSTCGWPRHELEIVYHDTEWGVPKAGEHRLYEDLVLDGAQAGLSWLTILKKREAYRAAFEGFDPARVAAYGEADVARLLADPGIIRNRAKVASAIRNARAFCEIQAEFGSYARFLWAFVDGRPRQNAWREMAEIPARTELSDAVSEALKQRGMNFVGSTIVYAMMQAIGMVNDHLVTCARYEPVRGMGEAFRVP
ncbi:MAG: DNA-3-methyladenine glycosylase I [Fimbriimonadaceae bacterium]|nr:DNA-3-methyladenine glycosylase I [Fimbriimonadaceae bacterium]